ncbi:rhomboid family intramembrane serine protease [Citrobacter sp. Res13-Lact-LER2-35-b]|uniref:rhomboid family intramembrane serine protease n=1 Tax=Citrobacter TaxID=544 RepID=UPI0018AA8447|nr:rhomboid family intramembrane serine protease [Citrobacter sp. Res13-Lact-LER2-35-b]
MSYLKISGFKNSKWAVTAVLVFVNFVFFVFSAYLDSRAFNLYQASSFIIAWGGNASPLTLSGEYWRLLSSMFMHLSIFHFFSNMIALLGIGFLFENMFSRRVFIAVYMLSGIAGGILSAVVHRYELIVSCGASGAILGITGYLLAFGLCNKIELPFSKIFTNVIIVICLGLFLPVDNMAHLGGFVTGFVLGALSVDGKTHFFKKPGKVSIILIMTVCIIEGAVLAKYSIPENIKFVRLSRLEFIVKDMREGAPDQPIDFRFFNQCVDASVESGSIVRSELIDCEKMRGLFYKYGLRIKERIEEGLNNCINITEDLRSEKISETEKHSIEIISNYCVARQKLVNISFKNYPNSSVDIKKYFEAEHQFNESVIVNDNSSKIFENIPELIFNAVSLERCRTTICRRW